MFVVTVATMFEKFQSKMRSVRLYDIGNQVYPGVIYNPPKNGIAHLADTALRGLRSLFPIG
jgi:hypothetical protein